MAKPSDKIENVLNESRILVLGIQILIGFEYRTFFEPGFEKMAPYGQQLQLAALGLMLFCLGILLLPAPYHRVVLAGRDTPELHRLATMTVTAGLLPFALSMGVSFFLGARWVLGVSASAILAGTVLALALFLWYGLELAVRRKRAGRFQLHALVDPLRETDMNEEQEAGLTTRVKQVLIECRVVLPGAQALLGFQLIIMWMTEFYKIPQLWKLLHLASLTSIAVCTTLLIMPAAYHRIVEQGEDSEALHQVTSRALLGAMVFLALGVSGDFYVVARVTAIGAVSSALLAGALLIFFFGAWFGYTFWKKHQMQRLQFAATKLAERRIA